MTNEAGFYPVHHGALRNSPLRDRLPSTPSPPNPRRLATRDLSAASLLQRERAERKRNNSIRALTCRYFEPRAIAASAMFSISYTAEIRRRNVSQRGLSSMTRLCAKSFLTNLNKVRSSVRKWSMNASFSAA